MRAGKSKSNRETEQKAASAISRVSRQNKWLVVEQKMSKGETT